MSNELKVLVPLTASQGLSGSSAAFSSLTVNGVAVTGGGGAGSGTVNTGDQYKLAYYSGAGAGTTVDDASGLLWDGSNTFTVSGSTLTSGSVNVGGNGGLTVANGLTVSAGAVSLPAASVANAALANSSVTVNTNNGLTGGGAVSLGGSLTLSLSESAAGNGLTYAGGVLAVGAGSHITVAADTVSVNSSSLAAALAPVLFANISGDITVNSFGVATIGANSVALGTDTTGNYVASVATSNGLSAVAAASEGAELTLEVSGASALTSNKLTKWNGTAFVNSGITDDGTDVTIAGNLTVNGTTTTVNTVNLTVDDANIILHAIDNATDALANGGGITLSGSTNKTFNWVSSSNSWTSSENMDLASGKVYKLDGGEVLSSAGGFHTFKNSTIGSVEIGTYFGSPVTIVSASGGVALTAPVLTLTGTNGTSVSNNFTVLGTSTLAAVNATVVTASTGVSASVFVLGNGFHLSSSAQLAGDLSAYATKTATQTAYTNLRQVFSGTLNGSGVAEQNLSTNANGKFTTGNLHAIAVDVMIHDGTGSYTNDLAAVSLFTSGSPTPEVFVRIDAPAALNRGYRLIAVDESSGSFTI